MNRLVVFSTLSVSVAVTSTALADFDVQPYAVGGQIRVGGVDDGNGFTYEQSLSDGLGVDGTRWTSVNHPITDPPPPLAYGYAFQEDPDQPFFLTDPGFNAASGSGLTSSTPIRFDALTSLYYWSGGDNVALSAPPSSEQITFSLGAFTVAVTGSSGAQAGFNLQTVAADGSMHKHLSTDLLGSDGNDIPAGSGSWGTGDGVQAANGIYFVGIRLSQPGSLLSSSDPFWLVFNNGLGDSAADQALDFAAITPVPEPATLSLLILGIPLCLRRRANVRGR